MKKKLIIVGMLLLLGIVFVVITVTRVLSGRTISTSLVRESFNETGICLNVPDDWVLFNVVDTYKLNEGVDKYLIIEGRQGTGSYPRLQVYRFFSQDSYDEVINIQTIIDLDIERIKSIDEIQIINDNFENKIETLSYEYLTRIVIFQQPDNLIHCKDWIGEIENQIVLVSICATEQQWVKLNEVYEEIIYSIEFIE